MGAAAKKRRMTFGRIIGSKPVSVLIYIVVIWLIVTASLSGAELMGYNWQWYRVPAYFWDHAEDGSLVIGVLPLGLLSTLALSAVAFIIAMAAGLLIAVLRLSDLIVGRAVARVLMEIVRNTPLLVLLYVFYYVLGPIFGMDRYAASIGCLALFHGALSSEIFRAGISAVAKGQWEAAQSIGMTRWQVFRYIIMPQSFRFILPPMTGEAVNVIKNSAIVSVIAVAELTTAGRNIISDTYMSFEIWFTVAAVYMVVTLAISGLASLMERRLAARE